MTTLIIIVLIIGAGLYFGKKWLDGSWDKDQKLIDELEAQHKVSKDKLRMLAFGAIMPFDDHDATRVLNSIKTNEKITPGLGEYWNIYDGKSAKAKLDLLLTEGSGREANETLADLRKYKDYKEFAKANPEAVADEAGAEFHKDFYDSAKFLIDSAKSVSTVFDDKSAPKTALPIDEQAILGVKSLTAWDYGRIVSVAKLCYTCGYLKEDEAWDYIKQASDKASKEYKSWQEFGLSYIYGRFLAYEPNYHSIYWSVYRLLAETNSIWNEVNFK